MTVAVVCIHVNDHSEHSPMLRTIIIAATFATVGATAALAHATLEQSEAKVGSSYKAVLRVPHGCEGKPTTTVRIQVPEGVIGVKPQPKPGWTLATTRGKYAKAYDFYGHQLTEGVKEIVWSGGSLPDDFYD